MFDASSASTAFHNELVWSIRGRIGDAFSLLCGSEANNRLRTTGDEGGEDRFAHAWLAIYGVGTLGVWGVDVGHFGSEHCAAVIFSPWSRREPVTVELFKDAPISFQT